MSNTSQAKSARAGLAAIEDALKDRSVDAVLTRETGEIAFHVVREI